MKELLEYRVLLIRRLREAAREFREACKAAGEINSKVEGEWSVRQIAAHTRDVEKFVYGARVKRTISEDNPEFKNFDADKWMSEHYNAEEPLDAILDEFTTNVEILCDTLENLPREAWSRTGRHEILGGDLTTQLWVERGLSHILEHLQTLKNVEKQ